MKIETEFETPVTSDANEVWTMSDKQDFTQDIWGQYRYMTDWTDIINYSNGHGYDEPLLTQRALAYLGFAMPSLAYTCPSQTADMSYYLHACNRNLPSRFQDATYKYFFSTGTQKVHRALLASLYHMISGKTKYDVYLDDTAQAIYDEILANAEEPQSVYGLSTVNGRFEPVTSLIAMMALEFHDKYLGTNYSDVNEAVLDFVDSKLRDPETGLFFQSYQTGLIGYTDEIVNKDSFWHPVDLKPNVNALAILFYNYFAPEEAQKIWATFKDTFTDQIMALTVEDICDDVNGSFQTQLGEKSEALFAAIAAAREMDDEEYFTKLQDRLFEIGQPVLTEGQLHFPAFGDHQHLMGFFILFARTHIPWKTLFEHPWEDFYTRNDSMIH